MPSEKSETKWEEGKRPRGGGGGGGGWGGSGIIQWGQKKKPPKVPGTEINLNKSHVELPSLKNFQKV